MLSKARAEEGEIAPIGGPEPREEADTTLARRSAVLRGALVRFFQRQVQDPTEVDDLVQEVFLRMVKRGGAGQLEHLDGYIFQTAASVLKDRGRRRKVRAADRHIPLDLDVADAIEPGAERLLIGKQALRAVGLILLEMPERTRRVFVLRRLEGLAYQEIGQRLGLSVSAVEKHMFRAVRHLSARTADSQ